MFNTEK